MLPHGFARENLDHVAAHISNLPGRESSAERRHVVAALGYRSNRGGQVPNAHERSAAPVSSLAIIAMTDRTCLLEKLLPPIEAYSVSCRRRAGRWRRWRRLSRYRPSRLSGRQLSVETEQPNAVSTRGTDEGIAR
jgi:hypothetical protein